MRTDGKELFWGGVQTYLKSHHCLCFLFFIQLCLDKFVFCEISDVSVCIPKIETHHKGQGLIV